MFFVFYNIFNLLMLKIKKNKSEKNYFNIFSRKKTILKKTLHYSYKHPRKQSSSQVVLPILVEMAI